MKQFKVFLMAVALLIGLSTGCQSKLQPGGAYAPATATVDANGTTNWVATAAPDKAFFVADSSFDLAYSTIDAAFKFEKENRALLWKVSPEIKHALDQVRPRALEVARKYALARSSYMLNPTPAGLSQLETILSEVQNIASAAQSVLPK